VPDLALWRPIGTIFVEALAHITEKYFVAIICHVIFKNKITRLEKGGGKELR